MGRLTIESGNNKAIIDIVQGKKDEEKVTINFEPSFKLNGQNTPDEIFVGNMTGLLIQVLKGE